ncbi:hypothetical protein [Streptomyces sp. BH105]
MDAVEGVLSAGRLDGESPLAVLDGTCRISRGSWEATVASPGTPGTRPV